MNYEKRRNHVIEEMEQKSILLLFSGTESHISADDYYPFEANRHFFYLTGLRREHMVLAMDNIAEKPKTVLFIPKVDPDMERWTGKMVTADEAKEISGIEDVRTLDELSGYISRCTSDYEVENFYFDCFRNDVEDMADYNVLKAKEYGEKFPGCRIINLHPLVSKLRMQKDEGEVELTRQAIEITKKGLEHVMRNLKPGKKEYQVQADFEYMIQNLGADGVAFSTIAGSGINGTMMHYVTNDAECADGSLILLDLGARYKGYNADITRTYPVNGKYSERQRQVYDIVLKANRTVAARAKAGMTTKELNDIARKVLAEGCIKLGLIEKEEDIGTYYMHGVSHHLGIDVHDVTVSDCAKLQPGAIISNEPGLYIDEWEIGIRIEDDMLITEDGCEVLSKDIIRDPDEIEAFMAQMA